MTASAPKTCLGCGCACDDIDVIVRHGAIAEARHACELGLAWFGDGRAPARVRTAGRDASLDEALAAAGGMLARAERPLIYLAPDLTCEAQREAIALGDVLRATVDSMTSATALGALVAAQELGRTGATLGEIRNRADVVVFWGVDPAERYPRYWTRYAPDPVGLHVGGGRQSRKVIAVDIGDARGPADADLRVTIHPRDEVSALRTLGSSSAQTGPAAELAAALVEGKYVVFVADGEAQEGRDPGRSAALVALTQSMNGATRCALSTLRGGGNRSGADACLTSQAGYPTAVDFARGFPRYRPFDGHAAARMARGEVDAVLVAGAAAALPADLADAMTRRPHAVVGPRATDSRLAAGEAAIDTAIAGIHEAGTALRMDDVPLPVWKCLDGPPEARPVLRSLLERIPRPG